MYIKISKTDCQNIVNQNLRGGGNSELEVALAKKCLSLYDRLGEKSTTSATNTSKPSTRPRSSSKRPRRER